MKEADRQKLAERIAAHANQRHSGAEHPPFPMFGSEEFAAILDRYIPDVPDEAPLNLGAGRGANSAALETMLAQVTDANRHPDAWAADETPLRKEIARLIDVYDNASGDYPEDGHVAAENCIDAIRALLADKPVVQEKE